MPSLLQEKRHGYYVFIVPHRPTGLVGIFLHLGGPAVPSPANMPAQRPERVAVFLDYENVRRSALEAFLPPGSDGHLGVVDPKALAERICEKRRRPSVLGPVYVYRGRPSPEHQPKPASAFDKYRDRWQRAGCHVQTRDLRYRFYGNGTFFAQEKGIDVALATKLIATAIAGDHDAVVVMSGDTDLLPAIEYVYYETRMHIEIANWSDGGSNALFIPKEKRNGKLVPFCHPLSETDFRDIREDGIFDFAL